MQSYTDKESKKKKNTNTTSRLTINSQSYTQGTNATNQQRHEGKGHNIKEQSTWGSGGHNHVNEN